MTINSETIVSMTEANQNFSRGLKIRPSNEEVVRVGLAVASGEMKYDGLLAWVREKAR